MSTAVLFCADPLRARRVEAHFAGEADAVRAVDGRVALIDHDALLAGRPEAAVARVPPDLGPTWYRGWMIPATHYGPLARALTARGVELVVDPAAYRRAHELPGWYPVFRPVTPRSVWMPVEPGTVPSVAEVAAAVAGLGGGPAVVKDFVKSRKHEWHEACYVPELTNVAGVHRVICRLVELQGDDLTGGVVIRAFEAFTDAGEARIWWLDGRVLLAGPHPDTPDRQPQPDLSAVAPLVAHLGCRFVTTDVARRADGAWRVVEVGDGQVSDLPRTCGPATLVTGLLAAAGDGSTHP